MYLENSQTSKLEKMGSKNTTFRCFVQNSCKHSWKSFLKKKKDNSNLECAAAVLVISNVIKKKKD